MSRLRIAIVGCGRIAQMAHIRALGRVDRALVVGLADPDAERLRKAAQQTPGASLFSDYRELLRSCDADAVVITLPSHLHAEAAVAAFEAGKHVYLEKPIAVDLESARAILGAQRESNKMGMVGFNFRFHAAYRAMRRELRAGRIGKIVGMRTAFCSAPRNLPDWKLSRSTGGSALLDLASHHVDLVHFLLEHDVAEVNASIRSMRSEADTASLQMWLGDGTLVTTFASMSAAELDRLEVIGEGGTLALDRYAAKPEVEFRPARRGGGARDRVMAAVGIATAVPARMLATLRPPGEATFESALRAFVDAALDGSPSPISLEEGMRSLSVILAAEESARLGRVISVSDLAPAAPRPVAIPASANWAASRPKVDATRDNVAVVVVTPDNYATIRRTVRHLRDQTICERIELILVGPTAEGLRERRSDEASGFASVTELAVGRIDNVDKAAAHGVYRARAAVVALVEDHAYPEPGWAGALLAAHEGPWAAVGSVVRNANPDSSLSWANLILAYGSWVEPVESGETRSVSRHNISFKKAALDAYGRDLEDMMGRDGGLLQKMLARGDRFFLEPQARILHANPSLLSSTVALRFNGGRIASATRARLESWSVARRMLYVVCAPLFPFLRARPLRSKIFARGRFPRVFPSIVMSLTLDGIGQAIGFLMGPGDTAQKLADFEVDRLRHVTPSDRRLLET